MLRVKTASNPAFGTDWMPSCVSTRSTSRALRIDEQRTERSSFPNRARCSEADERKPSCVATFAARSRARCLDRRRDSIGPTRVHAMPVARRLADAASQLRRSRSAPEACTFPFQPGGTSVVASSWVTIAGPAKRSPAPSVSRSKTRHLARARGEAHLAPARRSRRPSPARASAEPAPACARSPRP